MAVGSTTSATNFPYNDKPIIVICAIGVVSNILLLFAFTKDPLKCFRNSATYLVISLAVSDSLTSLLALLHHAEGATGSHETFQSIVLWFGTASFLSIFSVSIDRYLIVAHPIKHRVMIKGKILLVWLALIWILSGVFSALRMAYGPTKIGYRTGVYYFGLILISISAVMYGLTYRNLKKQSRNMASLNSSESRAQEIRILTEKRFLNTVIIIAAVACVCVLPTLILFQIIDYGVLLKDHITLKVVATLSMSIFYMNFAVNPLIYVLRLPKYRKTFQLLYCTRG